MDLQTTLLTKEYTASELDTLEDTLTTFLRQHWISPFEYFVRGCQTTDHLGSLGLFHLWKWSKPEVPDNIGDKLAVENKLVSAGIATTSSYAPDISKDRVPTFSDARRRIIKPIFGTKGEGIVEFTPDNYLKAKEDHPEGLIIQERLNPNPATLSIQGDKVMTVRVITFQADKDSPCTHHVVARYSPDPNTLTDNFTGGKNLVFPVTEQLLDKFARRGCIDAYSRWNERTIIRPPNNVFVDYLKEVLPNVLQIATWVHNLYNTRFVGWDIALTDKGPVVLEGNDHPGITAPQIAFQRGYLDLILHESTLGYIPPAEKLDQVDTILEQYKSVVVLIIKALTYPPSTEGRRNYLRAADEKVEKILNIWVDV